MVVSGDKFLWIFSWSSSSVDIDLTVFFLLLSCCCLLLGLKSILRYGPGKIRRAIPSIFSQIRRNIRTLLFFMPLFQSLHPRKSLSRHLLLFVKRRLSSFPEIIGAFLEKLSFLGCFSCVLFRCHWSSRLLHNSKVFSRSALSCDSFLDLNLLDMPMRDIDISLEIPLLQVLLQSLDFLTRHPRCDPLLFLVLIKSGKVEFQLGGTDSASFHGRVL